MGNVTEKDEHYEKERKIREAKALESMLHQFKGQNELDLTRFLLAREHDYKKTKEMFEDYLKWTREYHPGITNDQLII
jgi:hypothetical protein